MTLNPHPAGRLPVLPAPTPSDRAATHIYAVIEQICGARFADLHDAACAIGHVEDERAAAETHFTEHADDPSALRAWLEDHTARVSEERGSPDTALIARQHLEAYVFETRRTLEGGWLQALLERAERAETLEPEVVVGSQILLAHAARSTSLPGALATITSRAMRGYAQLFLDATA